LSRLIVPASTGGENFVHDDIGDATDGNLTDQVFIFDDPIHQHSANENNGGAPGQSDGKQNKLPDCSAGRRPDCRQ
jgi:hypothetical protein